MIKASTFKGQKLAIFGLGRSGLSTALSLKAGGATVCAWDDNEKSREAADALGIPLCDLTQSDWSEYAALVLSPGVPHKLPSPHWSAQKAISANVDIICDIEIFAREVKALPEADKPKIIAITGTNGKSTTTALIGHILKESGRDAQIGGNIGRGVLDLDAMHSGAYYVLELSSYQLERTSSLQANVAVFLNLSPDHLDRHGGLKEYGTVKERIFLNQQKKDTVIVGVDNAEGKQLCTKLMAKNGRSIIPISGRKSIGRGVYAIKGNLYSAIGDKTETVANLAHARALEGEHNAQNAAAALAAISALGLETREISKAILNFPGLEHRMETVGKVGPARFVNDSKATNADAARQALKSYKNIYWIAGGQAKEGGIAPLADLFPNVKKAYLIGDAADDFQQTLTAHSVDNVVSKSLNKAIIAAIGDALKFRNEKSIILLSPACASFDQFKSYEQRGDVYRQLCLKVIEVVERKKTQAKDPSQHTANSKHAGSKVAKQATQTESVPSRKQAGSAS